MRHRSRLARGVAWKLRETATLSGFPSSPLANSFPRLTPTALTNLHPHEGLSLIARSQPEGTGFDHRASILVSMKGPHDSTTFLTESDTLQDLMVAFALHLVFLGDLDQVVHGGMVPSPSALVVILDDTPQVGRPLEDRREAPSDNSALALIAIVIARSRPALAD